MEHRKYAIFVYGTLMKGERADHMLADYEYIGEFVLKDYALYQVSYYPGIKEEMEECVIGEAYWVDDACIEEMDRYEDEGSLYLRKTVQIANERERLESFVYVYNREVKGPVVRGRWNGQV